jgi:hypothetical protein
MEGIALHRGIGEEEAVLPQPLRRLQAARVSDPRQLPVDPPVQLGANSSQSMAASGVGMSQLYRSGWRANGIGRPRAFLPETIDP